MSFFSSNPVLHYVVTILSIVEVLDISSWSYGSFCQWQGPILDNNQLYCLQSTLFTTAQFLLRRHSLQLQHNSLYRYHFVKHRMDILIKKCIFYNSKFSFMSEYLGTNDIVVKRVHCISIGRVSRLVVVLWSINYGGSLLKALL